jgi:SpoVK/Ycf46/Vps4 family AAA+-type ATPase
MVPGFVPGTDGKTTLVTLQGTALSVELEVEGPEEGGKAVQPASKTITERPIKLNDVAGYQQVRRAIEDEVIWSRRNPHMVRGCSRAAGILFYGPPGCGKSRLARAICGELEQEVRLVVPSDMKGRYIGWGQHLIREHFEWLFDESNRVLLIDEFDAIARSRSSSDMHSDEKADVNEMLVQLDKATRRGSMVICTTNYLASLDEAVLRSGRFSHFIPVSPPDQEAALAIVSYYLDRLGRDEAGGQDDRLQVDVPAPDQVRQIVADLWKQTSPEQGRLCGADLEAAVNSAYIRAAREASRAVKAEKAHVVLREDSLRGALSQARRSVSVEAMERFCAEIKRHSSGVVFEAYQASLGM